MPPVFYHLNCFPPEELDWKRLLPLVGKANAALARYDGLIRSISNSSILLSPLMTQEAVLSSTIEGTNVTLSEVLAIEAGANENAEQVKRDDTEEVLNYRKALGFASKQVKERGFTLHTLRETHARLMQGVRGSNKNPGAFRVEQNWIGPKGCSLEEASFVPVPQEHLLTGMEAWRDYVHRDEEPDPLIQLALLHVEFEALHPFKDGNGRLGRMLIPLFLHWKDVLCGPNLYMSGYLESRKDEYVKFMRNVSENKEWTEWVVFFLNALLNQASENQIKAERIIELHRYMLQEVPKLTHSQFSASAVESLFSRPIFSTAHFVDGTQIPKASATRMLTTLRDAGIISVLREGSGRRPTFYLFDELLQITES